MCMCVFVCERERDREKEVSNNNIVVKNMCVRENEKKGVLEKRLVSRESTHTLSLSLFLSFSLSLVLICLLSLSLSLSLQVSLSPFLLWVHTSWFPKFALMTPFFKFLFEYLTIYLYNSICCAVYKACSITTRGWLLFQIAQHLKKL